MATEHENTSAEDQALADEWAAALEETGDVGQDDIDALLAADQAREALQLNPMVVERR